jgi:hypothetical protein
MELLHNLLRSLNVMDNVMTSFADLAGGSPSEHRKNALQEPSFSSALTPGDVIFVTILVIAVVLAVGFAIRSVLQKRKQSREEQEALKNQAMETVQVEMGSDLAIDNLFGIDAQQGEEGFTDRVVRTGGRRGSRRASMESIASGYSTRSSGSGYHRRDSGISLSSRVSNDYKFAAMEHMNRIAQTGRHD